MLHQRRAKAQLFCNGLRIVAKTRTLKFDPSARLQSLLGRELISNEYVAMAEIVRNAYDAGANQITIKLESGDPQRFVITDNGSGMSKAEFERVWMTPGFSTKAESGADQTLLGEKGIGRFAVDKIASELIITTKIKTRLDSLRIRFNWDRFSDQNKKLKDIRVPVTDVRDEELSKAGNGTRLELVGLRKQWRVTDWEDLRAELLKLIVPTGSNLHFKIVANSSSWSSGNLIPTFDGSHAYQYFFSVNKEGRGGWNVTRSEEIQKKLSDAGHKVKSTESGEINISNSFGAMKGRFFFFERPAQITKQGFESGVAIYRDGFRVEPYGRSGDDWVEVKLLKSKRHGKVPITPSRLFGYTEISRSNNPRLRDLTNREGIQDSPEFEDFRRFVIDQFLDFAGIVGVDKDYLPTAKSITAQKRSTSRESKSEALATLADQLAHQLKQPMTVISTSVDTMRLHLENHGGLDAAVETYHGRIQESISRLNSNIDDLTDLAKALKGKASSFELVKTVKAFVDLHTENFSAQGILLSTDFELPLVQVRFSKPVLHFVLDNFLTNALKATLAAEHVGPVVVKVVQTGEGKVRILVQDSGVEIPKKLEKSLFDEPVTSSDGWGKGLYYSKLRVEPFAGIIDWYSITAGKVFYLEIG